MSYRSLITAERLHSLLSRMKWENYVNTKQDDVEILLLVKTEVLEFYEITVLRK